MAKINFIKKSRKEHKCGNCGKIIEKGNPYQWIAFNYGPTHVRCNDCGFKPYETTNNEYLREIGRISYDYGNRIEEAEDISSLEELKDEIVGELETIKEDLEDRLYNLPEQFQDSGPGEVIQERIDSLENVIEDLEDMDFEVDIVDWDVESEDWDTILDAVNNLEDTEGWSKEEVQERYQEWLEELKEQAEEEESEAVDTLKEEIQDALDNIE